jgi:uncharacterized membrane protein YvbJ
MAERVSTGGNVSFDYGKDYNPKLDKERKEEINKAYEKYYERKKREKRNRVIVVSVIILIVVLLIIWFVFSR